VARISLCVSLAYSAGLGRFQSQKRLTVGVLSAGWVDPPEVWFDRIAQPTDSWRQQKMLLGDEVIRLQTMDAKSREAADEKRNKSTAKGALNRGRQAGEIPWKLPRQVSFSEAGEKIFLLVVGTDGTVLYWHEFKKLV
jgi:hypothetical protein